MKSFSELGLNDNIVNGLNMEGITILNQTEVMEPTPLATTTVAILTIISIISCIAFFIAYITMVSNVCPVILAFISISSLVTVLVIGILSPKHLTGYEYEATIDENVPMKEVYERYEIVEQRGDIWVLRDKED